MLSSELGKASPPYIRMAGSTEFQAMLKQLSTRLMNVLRDTRDPRLDDAFGRPTYAESLKSKAAPDAAVESGN